MVEIGSQWGQEDAIAKSSAAPPLTGRTTAATLACIQSRNRAGNPRDSARDAAHTLQAEDCTQMHSAMWRQIQVKEKEPMNTPTPLTQRLER